MSVKEVYDRRVVIADRQRSAVGAKRDPSRAIPAWSFSWREKSLKSRS
jgi:hypothetical protein